MYRRCKRSNNDPSFTVEILTNYSSLVILIRIELVLSVGSRQRVMGLFNQVVAVGDLTLLESSLVNVNLGVILQIHYFLFFNK